MALNVELSVPHSDKFLAQVMPTSKWPPNLDLIGFMPSKAAPTPVDRLDGDQACQVFVKMNVRPCICCCMSLLPARRVWQVQNSCRFPPRGGVSSTCTHACRKRCGLLLSSGNGRHGVQEEAVQNLFLKYAANICFFSWAGSPVTVVLYSKDTLQGRFGLVMRESLRARNYPTMQALT